MAAVAVCRLTSQVGFSATKVPGARGQKHEAKTDGCGCEASAACAAGAPAPAGVAESSVSSLQFQVSLSRDTGLRSGRSISWSSPSIKRDMFQKGLRDLSGQLGWSFLTAGPNSYTGSTPTPYVICSRQPENKVNTN